MADDSIRNDAKRQLRALLGEDFAALADMFQAGVSPQGRTSRADTLRGARIAETNPLGKKLKRWVRGRVVHVAVHDGGDVKLVKVPAERLPIVRRLMGRMTDVDEGFEDANLFTSANLAKEVEQEARELAARKMRVPVSKTMVAEREVFDVADAVEEVATEWRRGVTDLTALGFETEESVREAAEKDYKEFLREKNRARGHSKPRREIDVETGELREVPTTREVPGEFRRPRDVVQPKRFQRGANREVELERIQRLVAEARELEQQGRTGLAKEKRANAERRLARLLAKKGTDWEGRKLAREMLERLPPPKTTAGARRAAEQVRLKLAGLDEMVEMRQVLVDALNRFKGELPEGAKHVLMQSILDPDLRGPRTLEKVGLEGAALKEGIRMKPSGEVPLTKKERARGLTASQVHSGVIAGLATAKPEEEREKKRRQAARVKERKKPLEKRKSPPALKGVNEKLERLVVAEVERYIEELPAHERRMVREALERGEALSIPPQVLERVDEALAKEEEILGRKVSAMMKQREEGTLVKGLKGRARARKFAKNTSATMRLGRARAARILLTALDSALVRSAQR